MKADKRRATFGAADDPVLTDIARMVGEMAVTEAQVKTFIRNLHLLGLTCEEAAEGLRMSAGDLADFTLENMPSADEPEWYEGSNPWDAHTVEFGDTIDRIDHALTLHEGEGQCVS